MCHERAAALKPGGLVLDVGFGDTPVTTKELQEALWAVEPSLRVLGVERDLSRVTPIPGVEVRASHFNVLAALGPAVLVRVMNVVRGYREDEVAEIRALLGHAIGDGGLFLEGSSDTEGHVLTAWVVGRRGEELVKEALLLWTDFSRGFSPWLFRDWLPRDLRRRVKPGEPVHALLSEWASAVEALGPGRSPQERFAQSLGAVAGLQATEWERAQGFVRWVPNRPEVRHVWPAARGGGRPRTEADSDVCDQRRGLSGGFGHAGARHRRGWPPDVRVEPHHPPT
ncbi:MAG: hypothetical protein AMXMBFR34_14810 [Myxococcaceae bacterium]